MSESTHIDSHGIVHKNGKVIGDPLWNSKQDFEDWYEQAIKAPNRSDHEKLFLKRLKDMEIPYSIIFRCNLERKRAERKGKKSTAPSE